MSESATPQVAGGFSLRRLLAMALMEWTLSMRRPMVWMLLAFLGLVFFGLAQGGLTITAGDSSVGGDKAWINSQFNIAMMVTLIGFLIYTFFVAVTAGMSVIRDDETKVSELLHSSPLQPAEYVWGKFLGIMLVFGLVMLVQLVFVIIFFQFMPIDRAEEIRGPFKLSNYLTPMVVFLAPMVLFTGAVCFAVGERTRKPILVFLLPVALFLSCIFFLWNWSPSWLDPRINKFLMIIEPSAFRWLQETWLSVDRGLEVYNLKPVGLDLTFALNRLWLVGASLVALAISVRHVGRAAAGDLAPGRLATWLNRRRDRKQGPLTSEASMVTEPLAALGMQQQRPSLLSGMRFMLQSELRELRNQPGLYLFTPLILLQVMGSSLLALGAFNTPLLNTPGLLALRSFNTLTLLVSFLLLFYTVESLEREKSTGFGAILNATPLRNAAMLFGKSIANAVVGGVVVAGAFLGAVIALLIQGRVGLEITPFFVLWGLLLVPTFIVWSAFCSMLHAITRDRYATYALALAALMYSGYLQQLGRMTWVWNWNLWNVATWSDFGLFQLNSEQLLLNRLLALGLAVLFLAIAVKLYGRRDLDASRIIHRLHPKSLVRMTLRTLPFAVIPITLAIMLGFQVRNGFQGDVAEAKAKDYWRKNIATYQDWRPPAIDSVEVNLDLEPAQRAFEVSGTYRFTNDTDDELNELLITPALTWTDRSFSINSTETEGEDRSGLLKFTLEPPLSAGSSLDFGFSHKGRYPDGATRNGGGATTFILPESVVLHTFGTSFLPLPGYLEGVGVDEDNASEARDYPDDYWEEELEPAFGLAKPFTTRMVITAPEEFIVNSVGILEGDSVTDGRRTTTWVSDYPVRLLNVVAGKWAVHEGEGTKIFYLPKHSYNIEEMGIALDASRRYYSEWFHPYPWQELKLSEFAALAGYAQGFPTNITFSESIGFLTDSTPESAAAFMVTAHEAAHQWWGNILTPGSAPGGNILSEGMSHYSTLLLHEQVLGLRERIGFARVIEDRYANGRVADSERPMVKIDGARAGDTTVTYDKGGWVMWMLHNLLGRDQTLAGLQAFINQYKDGPDFPVLQDLVETLRPFASDDAEYQAFVDQWFFDVVVPEYKLSDEVVTQNGDRWTLEVTLENIGTGVVSVEVAAETQDRWPDEDDESNNSEDSDSGSSEHGEPRLGTGSIESQGYQAVRETVVLGPNDETRIIFTDLPFEPKQVIVDPDALVLQLRREAAILRF